MPDIPVKLTRYKNNPILAPDKNNSFEAQTLCNAGIAEYKGKIQILYRAEGFEKRENRLPTKRGITRLGLAVTDDGYNIEKRLTAPVIDREPDGTFAEHGIQDPRIAKIGDTYYIMCAAVSRWGDRLIMYTTKDFETFRKFGYIQPEHEMRTAGLFPAKFGDYYCCLLRYSPNIWISYTKDFKTWHQTKLLKEIEPFSWCGEKIGLGATPIRQDNAWLLFWHGVSAGLDRKYHLGIMWLDLKDPSKILKVQKEPILSPEADYEKKGFVDNVVYTCGAAEKNGKYLVYYGGADLVLAVADVDVDKCRI